MIRREKLIAVISSGDIHPGGRDGWALVITDGRIVGTRRPEAVGVPEPFLWVAGRSADEGRDAAEKMAAGLIERKRFELSKEGIFKILYEAPGLFFGGRVVFESVGERVDLGISVLSAWNRSTLLTVRALVDSLLAFAPDKLYDEKTGALVRDKLGTHGAY
jgi:hypothetical protein